jgi:hypothetical protein
MKSVYSRRIQNRIVGLRFCLPFKECGLQLLHSRGRRIPSSPRMAVKGGLASTLLASLLGTSSQARKAEDSVSQSREAMPRVSYF